MVVEDGKIAFVGSSADAEQMAKWNSVTVDLKGKAVFPGFHDVHNHIMEASNIVGGTCMLDKYRDLM